MLAFGKLVFVCVFSLCSFSVHAAFLEGTVTGATRYISRIRVAHLVQKLNAVEIDAHTASQLAGESLYLEPLGLSPFAHTEILVHEYLAKAAVMNSNFAEGQLQLKKISKLLKRGAKLANNGRKNTLVQESMGDFSLSSIAASVEDRAVFLVDGRDPSHVFRVASGLDEKGIDVDATSLFRRMKLRNKSGGKDFMQTLKEMDELDGVRFAGRGDSDFSEVYVSAADITQLSDDTSSAAQWVNDTLSLGVEIRAKSHEYVARLAARLGDVDRLRTALGRLIAMNTALDVVTLAVVGDDGHTYVLSESNIDAVSEIYQQKFWHD